MRLALIVPTRRDPAHLRVADSLAREYRALGHRVQVFPGRREGERSARKRLRGLLDRGALDACHIQFFSRGLAWLGGIGFPRPSACS